MLETPEGRRLLAGYGAVGLLNSALGWTVILVFEFAIGFPPALANAAGFAAGFVCGFLCHRRLFSAARTTAEAVRYAAAVAVAFAANQGALPLMQGLCGGSSSGRLAAQIVSVSLYSGLMFIMCRVWVFPRKARAALPGR